MTSAITGNFALLEQAVAQFDGRFTLRVLRSISSVRKSKHMAEAISIAISHLYSGVGEVPSRQFLLTALGHTQNGALNGDAHKTGGSEPLPEAFVYLAILVQVGNIRPSYTNNT
jgi:26S proteasome regulatory subunit N3